MRHRGIHSHKILGVFFFCLLLFLANKIRSAEEMPTAEPHVAVFTLSGAIGPATSDYLMRSMDEARAQGASLFLIKMDTPGGLDAATRDIIKAILASDIPVITYVHPAGGRAASAGTYILYASHIAAMAPSTTLGAATPVSLGAPGLPSMPQQEEQDKKEDEGESEKDVMSPGTAMERKVLNDSIAFIRGLAKRHGRNEQWAEDAVRSAATLTASEAQANKVIDVVAASIDELLEKIDGRKVRMETGEQHIASSKLTIRNYAPDWRNNLLAIITNPQIAYILMMIGIYGLILEGYNPGALVPGIIGAICLLTAFYALQVLPVNYAGLALIILGVLLIVAETMAPSFGILGIGGVVATTLGSIMLIDSDVPGMEISRTLIGSIAAASSLLVLAILFAVGRSLRIERVPVEQAMVGNRGTVESFAGGKGLIRVGGELWEATSAEALHSGDQVRVQSQNGLILGVRSVGEE